MNLILIHKRLTLHFSPGADLTLPWYVKTFWVLHNVSVPVAFLITMFYWLLLYSGKIYLSPYISS